MSLEILNRAGHSISYSEIKSLETEFAYSIKSYNDDVSDGIQLSPNLATASVWDSNDKNIETLDGKDTFHATVGHTYQNIVPGHLFPDITTSKFRQGRNRRRFSGNDQALPPFHRSLNTEKFTSCTTDTEINSVATASAAQREIMAKVPQKIYIFWGYGRLRMPLHLSMLVSSASTLTILYQSKESATWTQFRNHQQTMTS